ncbi:recombinase RecB [Actinoplanes capillaceus]|uniref:Recombinase RecB n=1 Tax=Actinoplanes campanulatus TaxID=113559 RepID=A0ABQ3WQP9_9ACTN|nr:TM0106 family RecB-like putative nuclease [Actinoplanes capillaceus]GID48533.1 recombinase RecB [Actinoplanes capillaceus]
MRPILFGGYAAKSCPRAVHNDYDPTVPRPVLPVAPELQALYDTGVDFETEVLTAWPALNLPGYVDLRDLDGDKRVHIGATIGAMRAGAAVVVGGRLPDDVTGGRTGKPDILLRDTGGGYHPADIKAHHVLDRKYDNALASTLKAPSFEDAVPLPDGGARQREEDLLQLAHYWRMLEACGHQATHPRGAICGDDRPGDPLLVWCDLTAPAFRTFSRTTGVATRSALERYDHEHGFRRRVADVARRRTGAAGDPLPLVDPIGQAECATCRWSPVCVDTLPGTDVSAVLRGALSAREYLALRTAGVHTVADLAASDPETLLTGMYGTEVPHLRTRAFRLRKAVTAARLAADGLIVRRRERADVPRAAVEVDIDIEWGADDRVYLWGLLITSNGASRYEAYFDPRVTTDRDEELLARRCLDRLTALAAGTPDLLVFHYGTPEPRQARRFPPLPSGPAGPDRWIDLLPLVRATVDSRAGHGLKAMATHGPGHTWRDPDPGGLQSQSWHAAARQGDQAAATRLLTYNEDDVRATLAVRTWLRS